MAIPVIMPKQGQSVESCIISQWFKKKGDAVKVGDILFSYETDKASFEEEAKVDGTLLEVFYNEGDEVPVLLNVAVIGNPGESVAEFNPNGGAAQPAETPAAPAVEAAPAAPAAPVAAPAAEAAPAGKVRISPRAKVMAEKKGIAYQGLKGTGPNGRIIVRDIEAALAQPAAAQAAAPAAARPAPAPVPAKPAVVEYSDSECEVKKLSNIRQGIARAMQESLQNSAQLTHHLSADVRKLQAFRQAVKAEQKKDPSFPNITLNDMVCWCVIRALEKFPAVNSQFLGDSIKTFKGVHLGLAVDTERGLMVPVLKNAQDLSLKGLSARLKALADDCKKGSINPDLLSASEASFTVSNLGNYGVEIFTPIINIPQVAILGVNTIIMRPVDLGGGDRGDQKLAVHRQRLPDLYADLREISGRVRKHPRP